jgi:c-di-GMP-binding flagellar brake protein YcgR
VAANSLAVASGIASSAGSPATARGFADFDLAIGTSLELRRVGVDESRYPTELVGCLRNATVLVRMPVADGKLVALREGQPVVIRAFSGTDAMSFATSVVAVRFVPEPYLHLKYPHAIECTAIRKQRRINVDLTASCALPGGETVPAIVLDMSMDGAGLALERPVGAAGDLIRLTLCLQTPGGAASLDVDAQICSVKGDSDQAQIFHGVKFMSVEPLQSLALRGFVALSGERRRVNTGANR